MSLFTDTRIFPLVTRIGRGEQSAFADLYDLTSSDLYGYLWGLGGDDAQASAALVDVYLEVWKTAPRFPAMTRSSRIWLADIVSRRVARGDRIAS